MREYSKSDLFILSKFKKAKSIEYFEKEPWTNIEKTPKLLITTFLDKKLLEPASIENILDIEYTVSELKEILKKRNLSVSGKKKDLIKKLLENNFEISQKRDDELFQLSEKGNVIINEYLINEEKIRNITEEESINALKDLNFKKASEIVAAFESKQIIPRGLGMDWKNHNSQTDIFILQQIFHNKPKILSKIDDEKLNCLRLAAGMSYLWGVNNAKKWLPSDFKLELIMNIDSAIRMLIFYASNKQRMETFKNRNIRIITQSDSCDECKNFKDKIYTIENLLELPYEHCKNPLGCRCSIVPYFPNESTTPTENITNNIQINNNFSNNTDATSNNKSSIFKTLKSIFGIKN